MQAQAWSGGRPSASGCLWKRGAEDDGSRRILPVLASLRRFFTVAGLHKYFQWSDDSSRMRQGGGRSCWGGCLRAYTPEHLGGGGWVNIWSKKRPFRATKRSNILLRRLIRQVLFIAKGGARGKKSHFWGPKWPFLSLRSEYRIFHTFVTVAHTLHFTPQTADKEAIICPIRLHDLYCTHQASRAHFRPQGAK
jgi:hypothetical protein